ncbi:phosphoribosylformylglycinamidine synthase [Candidatus Azobacteroides pseudotrichonymphae]|uniref:Phosphoribosylformylglycinamidine synthase n=1 Tax=Azobacteroides pseudotrichonymphae genomovar. CFP2 TaxID=511995 RepID=B6YRP2_AZOPC|nr:phosphoribosylformylglycinamidine synthase [Candidatus Azobacteroides pseudotrichonymphae]BAG83864.1 phosphoribosylformylglycinamidine synthase [Candidatus Azobacteroides pseudotrichonymphae genomovar. CFP2]
MVFFFKAITNSILAVQTIQELNSTDIDKLIWLFGGAELLKDSHIDVLVVGPRREMITPWSTNAMEITQIMGIKGILRIEKFQLLSQTLSEKELKTTYDPMLYQLYRSIGQDIFTINKKPEGIILVKNIANFNSLEGLALSEEEIDYLNGVSKRLGRHLTDSEVFGFSQVNSEHCRHKIFNGTFIIDGVNKKFTLFQLIRRTSEKNPNYLVSAYKDNVAFNQGPIIKQFAPAAGYKPDFFEIKEIETVISLKAETHNFPTTVEPFNGASTGSGGEIRDRLGGGKASLPIAGIAVYMTSYLWNKGVNRKWLYQSPEQILIKASNGASDFGNKFGQPLICGSVLTFEHQENGKLYGYDKVIMLAGGIGFAKRKDALKGKVKVGEKIIVLGGDNYRIGMGGGAVSSVDTGEYCNGIELNAVQRANPEMQKRIANVIRTLSESNNNPIISIHDHGAGGHLNCFSELVENTGGYIEIDKLPIGDPTLSAKEIIGNESQERMGLLLKTEDVERVSKISERERSPMYIVGKTTGDMRFVFEQKDGKRPLDMHLNDFFGKPPHMIIRDVTVKESFKNPKYNKDNIFKYIEQVLKLEAVACKDWLTNKVDRSVTGMVARQQCVGEIQLPLSDLGVVALDYYGQVGIATAIGHAPQIALVDSAVGSVMAIAESLTNILFAPLKNGLKSVSLSANWMWACKNKGEDARLYKAVEACSQFACDLGINIPTGKDSLSMTQKYKDSKVYAPGTVIISAAAEVSNIRKIVSPVLVNDVNTTIYYIDFSSDNFKLGGSAFAQSLDTVGQDIPTVNDTQYFKKAFNIVQGLIKERLILSGHDISAGGMITTLLEMCFANETGGMKICLSSLGKGDVDIIKKIFSENVGIIIQVKDTEVVEKYLNEQKIRRVNIGSPMKERCILLSDLKMQYRLDINYLRDIWYYPSYLLDRKQSGKIRAKERFANYKHQILINVFPKSFDGKLSSYNISADRKIQSGIKAAIIREKGTNGEREMAYALYLAGFDVKDVHMTDLATGRETLEEINMIVFCGGFSNSDVLGSAKGWAGAFRYNEKSATALRKFYARDNTLSLGVCNGCQLMVELSLIYSKNKKRHLMLHNNSHKFESGFVSVEIPQNHSIMFRTLSNSKLGIWIAHGEGKFQLPMKEHEYHIVAKYVYNTYPGNPNGSDYAVAGICSEDGRHLALMPHLERAVFPWQWAYYPQNRNKDEVSPWIEAFVNARKWISNKH